MLMKLKMVFLLICVMVLAGCSHVEENYKPLYQAKPEKHAIEGGL